MALLEPLLTLGSSQSWSLIRVFKWTFVTILFGSSKNWRKGEGLRSYEMNLRHCIYTIRSWVGSYFWDGPSIGWNWAQIGPKVVTQDENHPNRACHMVNGWSGGNYLEWATKWRTLPSSSRHMSSSTSGMSPDPLCHMSPSTSGMSPDPLLQLLHEKCITHASNSIMGPT